MRNNSSITIPEIAATLHMSTRNIEKHIANLQAQGIIRRIGGDFGGHWEIIVTEG